VTAQNIRGAVPTAALSTFDATFDVESSVAISWIDGILAHACKELSPADVIGLLWCRSALVGKLPLHERTGREAPHPLSDGLARQGIRQFLLDSGQSRYAAPIATEKLLKELKDAAFGKGAIAGTAVAGLQLVDALAHSLPATWHVRLQGGTWELYDANKTARKHAFGSRGKASFPVRMKLRARGAQMRWLSGFRSTPNGMVAAVPHAASLPQALESSGANRAKFISDTAFKKLPVRGMPWGAARGVLGSTSVGLAISFGPQVYADVQDAGLLANPKSKEAWRDFAVRTAGSLPGNVAGLAGAFAGAELAALVATGIGVAAGAPVLVVAAFAGGVLGAAGFNFWGLNERAQEAAQRLLAK
jgi:hypothetical protein